MSKRLLDDTPLKIASAGSQAVKYLNLVSTLFMFLGNMGNF